MFVLIVVIILGLIFSYFATQNTVGVTLKLNDLALQLPLYIIVLGSLLLGIVISWIMNLTDVFASFLTIHGKDSAIKQDRKVISNLKNKMHDLEIENARLKGRETNKTTFVEGKNS